MIQQMKRGTTSIDVTSAPATGRQTLVVRRTTPDIRGQQIVTAKRSIACNQLPGENQLSPGISFRQRLAKARRRLWQRCLKWLVEPIPFPGMTYDIDDPDKRYNQEETPPSQSPRGSDERRSTKSR
jgi:hypothetical protein